MLIYRVTSELVYIKPLTEYQKTLFNLFSIFLNCKRMRLISIVMNKIIRKLGMYHKQEKEG